MHNGMQYDPIKGQGQGREKSGRFQKLSPPPFKMGDGNWPLILKLAHSILIWLVQIFDIWSSFCHVTLQLAQMSVVKSRPSVPVRG